MLSSICLCVHSIDLHTHAAQAPYMRTVAPAADTGIPNVVGLLLLTINQMGTDVR